MMAQEPTDDQGWFVPADAPVEQSQVPATPPEDDSTIQNTLPAEGDRVEYYKDYTGKLHTREVPDDPATRNPPAEGASSVPGDFPAEHIIRNPGDDTDFGPEDKGWFVPADKPVAPVGGSFEPAEDIPVTEDQPTEAPASTPQAAEEAPARVEQPEEEAPVQSPVTMSPVQQERQAEPLKMSIPAKAKLPPAKQAAEEPTPKPLDTAVPTEQDVEQKDALINLPTAQTSTLNQKQKQELEEILNQKGISDSLRQKLLLLLRT